MKRLKRNDIAFVIAGDDAGKTGKVLSINETRNRITIEGVNLVFKHVRRSQQNPQGGRIQREASFDMSNVLPYCEKCGKGVRIRVEVSDGTKQRVCKSCSTPLQ